MYSLDLLDVEAYEEVDGDLAHAPARVDADQLEGLPLDGVLARAVNQTSRFTVFNF